MLSLRKQVAPKVKPTGFVDATVNAVMPEQGKVNVNHAAIPDWGWPSAWTSRSRAC